MGNIFCCHEDQTMYAPDAPAFPPFKIVSRSLLSVLSEDEEDGEDIVEL